MEEQDPSAVTRARLLIINSVLADMLLVADAGDEHLISAMIADSRDCVMARLAALGPAEPQR